MFYVLKHSHKTRYPYNSSISATKNNSFFISKPSTARLQAPQALYKCSEQPSQPVYKCRRRPPQAVGGLGTMEKKAKRKTPQRPKNNTCYICRKPSVGKTCRECYLRKSNKRYYTRTYETLTERISVPPLNPPPGSRRKIWKKVSKGGRL